MQTTAVIEISLSLSLSLSSSSLLSSSSRNNEHNDPPSKIYPPEYTMIRIRGGGNG